MKQLSVFISNRNRAKQNSLTKLNFIFMLTKTIFATTSRILLFSAWLYVVNDGQFSTLKTLIAYYTTALVLFFFTVSCNTRKPSCSSSFWIGKIICTYCTKVNKYLCMHILRCPAQHIQFCSFV